MEKIFVQLVSIHHRQQERILIKSAYNQTFINKLKQFPDIHYSSTHKAWHMPNNKDLLQKILFATSELAVIDSTNVSATSTKHNNIFCYTNDRYISPVWEVSNYTNWSGTTAQLYAEEETNHYSSKYILSRIHPVNRNALHEMKQYLQLKAYSSSTIKTYLNEMAAFLQTIKGHKASDFSVSRIKDYLQYCYVELGLSENTLHSRMNALKFYYEQVLKRDRFFWEIPRPKKRIILPKVLGEDELGNLFRALQNKKHKAMLFTAYSAGLRVSEIAGLKIKHIDSDRMLILVENAKGKKDRYVNLSPVLLDILRDYFRTYKPRPKTYLFESEMTGGAYPVRTIQKIFQNAKENAGIKKDTGIHGLRHSFATHLLEKGTDIKYIKEVLGHFNIKTTERYLHVSKKMLVNIVSPLDDLYLKGKIDWF